MATTASSSRHHRHRDRTNRDRSTQHLTTLPTYEPPTAPLNPAGQRALAALLQSHSLRHLKAHLQHASEKLAETASEANERLTDARVRYERQKERRQQRQQRRGDGEGEDGEAEGDGERDDNDDDDEKQKLARMEERVNEVTGKLEETMRRVVDAEVKLDGLTGVVGELGREADEANTQQGRRTSGGGRRRTRRRGGGEDEDEEDGSDEDYEEQEEDEGEDGEGGRRRGEKPPSQKLEDKLAEQNAKWEAMSLTQRYVYILSFTRPDFHVHIQQHPLG